MRILLILLFSSCAASSIKTIQTNDKKINKSQHYQKMSTLAFFSKTKQLQDLINSKNLNINHAYTSGDTLLHKSIFFDRKEVFNFLINKEEINPNLINAFGETPLIIATTKCDLFYIKSLINIKASPGKINIRGESLQEIAEQCENPSIRLLIKTYLNN